MRKKFISLYLLTILMVFLLICSWEFWLEDILTTIFFGSHEPESLNQRWEFIYTVVLYCAVALAPPLVLANIAENKRLKAEQELNKNLLKLEAIPGESTTDQSRDELRVTRISLQSVIDEISEMIMVIGLDYRVKMANRAVRELFINNHYDSGRLFCHQITHQSETPCDSEDHPCPMRKVIETRRPFTVIHTHTTKDGVAFPVEIIASPIIDELGEVIGIIEAGRDISARLADQAEKKKLQNRLFQQQKDETISMLVGGLAHEFNNVLTSVLGNAELLMIRLSGDNSSNLTLAKTITKAARRMATLTDQLLAFAKGGKYIVKEVAVNKLITDALKLTHKGKAASCNFSLDLATDLWTVMADANQIEQMLVNLFRNSFEAMEETGGNISVETANRVREKKWECALNKVHPAGDYINIIISDTGPGIPADIREKIFEPFFSTKFLGRGLGLAAVKGIVQNHDGCIKVENLPGRGTRFNILLPRAQQAAPVQQPVEPSTRPLHLKILAIDDEQPVLQVLHDTLELFDCEVLTADNGSAALETFKMNPAIDLIILDIQMPDMHGTAIYKELKKINPNARILISSGYNRETALQGITLSPRDNYIKKPFQTGILCDTIEVMMNQ